MKKNQVALVFLTIITMLAVWYFKTPTAMNNDEEPSIIVSTNNSDSAKFQAMRDAIREERSKAIEALNNIIADENASLVSINNALIEKAELSSLTELEILVETKVTNLGYSDAFVHSSVNGIEVIVVANESSATEALEIIDLVFENFSNAENVVVNFMTSEEQNNV